MCFLCYDEDTRSKMHIFRVVKSGQKAYVPLNLKQHQNVSCVSLGDAATRYFCSYITETISRNSDFWVVYNQGQNKCNEYVFDLVFQYDAQYQYSTLSLVYFSLCVLLFSVSDVHGRMLEILLDTALALSIFAFFVASRTVAWPQ